MSEKRIEKLEGIADEHGKRLIEVEKQHAVNDERLDGWAEWRKRVDARFRNVEGNISWGVKIVLGLIITAVVGLAIKGGGAL